MREAEELLQKKLEQLEAGLPLSVCLVGLKEEEADLVYTAALLRDIPYPVRDVQAVAGQRANLLQLATKEKPMQTHRSQDTANSSILTFLSGWLRGRTAPQWAMAALLAPAFVLVLIVAISSLGRANPDMAEQAPAAGISEGVDQVARSTAVAAVTSDDTSAGYPGPSVATVAPAIAGSEPENAGVVTAPSGHELYVPVVSSPLVLNPATAALQDLQGLVEVQGSDGAWTTVRHPVTLGAGQRVRTGAFSSAQLTFFDGSQAHLGPGSELSIDELNAQQPEEGFRTVILTQWLGESEHEVAFRNDGGSRYEVKTPNGSGIARGTIFHVTVTPALLTFFRVDEGAVAVTNINVTVLVIAGQMTTINSGSPPDQPLFRITGEGEVTQIGPTWIIAGQAFETTDSTVIIGGPQVGDTVYVEGRLLADGTRVADRIVLLRRSPVNRFSLTGEVEAMGVAAWTVTSQSIAVDDETEIDEGIEIGDRVRIEGVIQPDGTLLARRIQRLETEMGLPFSFTGIVETMAEETWTISGVAVMIDADAAVDEGIEAGDVVAVAGWILDSGDWLARTIELVEPESSTFEFSGVVQSIDPWAVAGISFETRDWTEIQTGIAVGDLVRVEGRILADGVWVATEITRLDDEDTAVRIVFVGAVTSVSPWVVSGIPLVTDGSTVILGDIAVGDLVRVEVTLRADGTWLATRIERLSGSIGQGCLTISAVVVSVSSNQLVVRNWPALSLDGVTVEGNIAVNSVVLITVCIDVSGHITIINIIVIYQPPPPAPPAPPPPSDSGPGNGLVAICKVPPGNPAARHTIYVAPPAVQAHLGNGSFLGPCP